MSKSRPTPEPVAPHEALAHFRHDGEDKRPGDIVELTNAQAEELTALGFVVRVYRRRDMQSRR